MTDPPPTSELGVQSVSIDAFHAEKRARLDRAAEAWVEAQRATFDIMRGAPGIPATDADLAEGYRWVTRLFSMAQEWFIEKSDPLHPVLFQLQDPYRKLLVDNPDVRYLFAVLDDRREYRLTGTRGGAAYVGMTFGTPIGKGAVGGRTGTLTQVHLDSFELGPDGEVDILITPDVDLANGAAPNSILLIPGTGQVAIRETRFDRDNDGPSDLRLDLLGDISPPALDADGLADRLEFAGVFVQFVAATASTMWTDSAENLNSFGGTAGAAHVDAQDDEVRSHSDADMTYHGGRWEIADGEMLVVTIHEPPTDFLYWGLTIANPWMESYDYRYTTTSLNNRSAVRSDDGTWRLVISRTDPGTANWLDTNGRGEGYMIVRWVLADAPPHPTCELVANTPR